MTHLCDLDAGARATLMVSAPDMHVGTAVFSWTSRVLCTASEFWDAASRRALRDHIAYFPLTRLLLGEVAFTAIGMGGVARIVRRGRRDLVKYPHASAIWRVSGDIETDFARLDKNRVEEALREYAAAVDSRFPAMADGAMR